MAYVSQEDKKELAPGIKAVLKKYGIKGSIAIRNHMVLVVNIKSGSLDIIGNWYNETLNDPVAMSYYNGNLVKPEYLDVNTYHINSHYTGIVKDFLNELLAAMKKPEWRNNSDIQSDYFDISYYTDINVGKWDKGYIFEG